MAKSINLVILQGNLTKDPKLRYTPNGNAVVSFSLATNEPYKDKQDGQWKEKAEFHNVIFWGQQAEFISQYIHKGDKATVIGRLQTRKWDDKNGVTRYTTEIVGNQFVSASQRKRDESAPLPDDSTVTDSAGNVVEDIVIPDDFGNDTPSPTTSQDEMPF